MLRRLENKVCLITGTTGIAGATAELAVREGAWVFLTSRTAEHGEALVQKLRSLGGESDFLAADLTRPNAASEVSKACLTRFGRIDLLFNVAGISGRRFGDGPIHECTEEGWDVTMDTNVKSMFLMCRAVLAQMLAQPLGANGLRGVVLNMASVLGFSPSPKFFGTHAYAASKGAIIALSRAMASYYAPEKIRVNVIAPALVQTPMSARAQRDPEILRLMETKQPLAGRMLEADEVARTAVFLLSDDANMVTGDVLTVDGGWCVSDGQH